MISDILFFDKRFVFTPLLYLGMELIVSLLNRDKNSFWLNTILRLRFSLTTHVHARNLNTSLREKGIQ